jgi:hypothetical protein
VNPARPSGRASHQSEQSGEHFDHRHHAGGRASALAYLAERHGSWGSMVAASLRSSAQNSAERGEATSLLRDRIEGAEAFLDECA